MGTKLALEAALVAASGATTPSIAPVPSFSRCLEKRFSAPYAMNEASVVPAPGRQPRRKPTTVPRAVAGVARLRSSLVSGRSRKRALMGSAIPVCSWLSSSPMANSPIMTSTYGTRPKRSICPKV